MNKNIFYVVGKLLKIFLLGVTVFSCKSVQYGVEISNVPKANIKAAYIRNAGTTNWGNNIATSLSNIDRSRYSQIVDIRVVDTNGVVYSKYDVSFNDAAFVESGETSSINIIGQIALLGGLGAAAYGLYKINP